MAACAAAALAAAGCAAMGKSVGRGAADGVLTDQNREKIACVAHDAGAAAGRGVAAGIEEERARVNHVIHEATTALLTTAARHLEEELGPALRKDVELAVQSAVDRLLAGGNQRRLEAALGGVVDRTLDGLGERLDGELRGRLGAALQATLRERVAPEIAALLDDQVAPRLGKMLDERVGPALKTVLERDLLPLLPDRAEEIGRRLTKGLLTGDGKRSPVSVVLIVAVSILGVLLVGAALKLYRTWYAADALRMVVDEIARQRKEPHIQQLAMAIKRRGKQDGAGRYLSKLIAGDDVGRNVFAPFRDEAEASDPLLPAARP
jgi:hypothetical protein